MKTIQMRSVIPADRNPQWAVVIIRISAVLGMISHSTVWLTAYLSAGRSSADNWIEPRMLLIPVIAAIPVFLSALALKRWACLVVLGTTWFGFLTGVWWLIWWISGADPLGQPLPALGTAVHSILVFLLPVPIAPILTAACVRSGILTFRDQTR